METFEITKNESGFHIEGFPEAVEFCRITGTKAKRLADLALHRTDLARIIREQAPTLTPARSLSEGEGVNSMPSPPEGERVRVRGRVGRRGRDRE